MKKILSFMLCVVFLFLVVGCGKTNTSSVNNTATLEELKPDLSQKQIYREYKSIIEEYENEHGQIIIPEDDDYDPNYKALNGVAYIDLVDFNLDNTDELVIGYYKPFEEDDTREPTEYRQGCINISVFAVQGEDVNKVFNIQLPSSEYRMLSGCTLEYGYINDKPYIFNCMDYTLFMPEIEPEESMGDSHIQSFTADCYYGYDGRSFGMACKKTWQGEGPAQIQMYNDMIYTYNSDKEPIIDIEIPEVTCETYNFSVSEYDKCVEQIKEIKKIIF